MKFLVEFNSAVVAWLAFRNRTAMLPINCYLNFGGLIKIRPPGDSTSNYSSATVYIGEPSRIGQSWHLYPGSGTFMAYVESKITSSSIDLIFTPVQPYTGDSLDTEDVSEVSRSMIPS